MAHILVVEDENSLRDVIIETLTSAGHTVTATGDGIEAMVKVTEASRNSQPFSLVICDIQLPGVSGLSVCDFVRLDPKQSLTPFLFLSGLGETEERLAGLARGADDYLGKPFLLAELVARINRLLQRTPSEPLTELPTDAEDTLNPLEQQTLGDLLRDIVQNRRDGTLHFLLHDGSHGQLAFREGKCAAVVGDGTVSPEEQVRCLFSGQVQMIHFA
ncbi:MAG: response regulator transcription factor [Acidobacteriota bacterium]